MAPGTYMARVHSVLSLINSKLNTYMPPMGKVVDMVCKAIFNAK